MSNCINDAFSNVLTSFHKSNRSKKIEGLVGMSSSLHLMKKQSSVINADRFGKMFTFNGQSDRRKNSKGVDQKHGSYSRYLGLKKGKLVCSDNWKYMHPSVSRDVSHYVHKELFCNGTPIECSLKELEIPVGYFH